MVSFLCMLVILSVDDPLGEAVALKNGGDLYTAEGMLLTLEPEPAQIPIVGAHLAEIALRLNKAEAKVTFYQGYLTRSRNWRGVSLYVLSALSAHLERWSDLENYATTLFQEYRFQGADYPLLYHLARFTPAPVEKLNLGEEARAWFQICRELDPEQIFPESTPDGAPYFLKKAHLLGSGADLEPPLEGEIDDESRYVQLLLTIDKAMVRDELHLAAQGINRLYPLDGEMNRVDLRVHFYPLLRDFFQKRGQQDQADATAAHLEQLASWVVFPYVVRPEQNRQVLAAEKVEPKPEPELPPEPTPEEPVARTDVVEKPQEPSEERTFEALEAQLLRNHRGLELAIRRKAPNTTFKRVYKNYLLGLYYVKSGRLKDAYEHLNLAQRLVVDFPFPNLEIKVMLTLADYYDASKNPDRANWYRIQAAQIWDTPDYLSIFARKGNAPIRSPYAHLIESILDEVTADGSVHSLLYYSEMADFQELRRKAYRRQILSSNRVISNQIQRTGDQVLRMTRSLAENPGYKEPAANYNRATELWERLWDQVQPYFRDTGMPSMSDLQRALNNRDRLLSFVEGVDKIGLLVISKDNAFAVGLGSKRQFLSLSEKAQFDFLEGRLGPVWRSADASLILRLSPSFRNDAFVNNLRKRMGNPSQLSLQFSLKAFVSPKRARSCRKALIVSREQDRFTGALVRSLPQAGLDWFFGRDVTREQIGAQLEIHERLILVGSFSYGEEGLLYQTRDQAFPIHEIAHLNPELCNLTLISPDFKGWVSAMMELELISPDASMTFYLTDKATHVRAFPDRKFGLYFP